MSLLEPLGSIKPASLRNLTMPRCLGGFALRWMECILGHESVQQTVQPFKDLGVVLSCDGIEGVLTRCFFVLFVLTRRQPLRVESV